MIIAHRGASYVAPENTIASVIMGFEEGADGVEIDIHLSKDKRLMVIHDKTTKRTAEGMDLAITDTDSNDLRKLDVGVWKDQKYKGEKIPFLEEILPLVPQNKLLFVEFKSGPEALSFFQKVIASFDNRKNLVIISFDQETIKEAKERFPDIPAYWLLGNYNTHTLDDVVRFAVANKLNGLNVHYGLVTEKLMQQTHLAGLEVFTYTVNDPEIAKSLELLGVNGITTDRAQWLKEKMLNP